MLTVCYFPALNARQNLIYYNVYIGAESSSAERAQKVDCKTKNKVSLFINASVLFSCVVLDLLAPSAAAAHSSGVARLLTS